MGLKENLKKYREARGLTLEYVAGHVGVSRQTVQKYESGVVTNIPSDKIEIMANIYGTTPSILMGWENESNIQKTDDTIVMLPVIGRVSAGNGCYAVEDIERYEPVPSSAISYGENQFLLRISGDSMYPIISDGDLVLIREQSSVDSGSIAVAIVDNEDGVIKYVDYDKEWIDLRSANHNYPTRHFQGEDVLRVRIVGLARQISRKL